MCCVPRSQRSHDITHAGQVVTVTYKDVKHLRLKVLPPTGRLTASVPFGVSEQTLRDFIDRQAEWIQRAQHKVRMSTPIEEPLVDGGRARVWGQWREVRIIAGERATARIDGAQVVLSGADEETRRRALDNLYKRELRIALPDLLAQWQTRIGKEASSVKLRRMTSRWGTCNTVTGVITLNVALAERPPGALEYVVVHELVHLWERGHGPRFTARMDRYLPGWRARRAALKAS